MAQAFIVGISFDNINKKATIWLSDTHEGLSNESVVLTGDDVKTFEKSFRSPTKELYDYVALKCGKEITYVNKVDS